MANRVRNQRQMEFETGSHPDVPSSTFSQFLRPLPPRRGPRPKRGQAADAPATAAAAAKSAKRTFEFKFSRFIIWNITRENALLRRAAKLGPSSEQVRLDAKDTAARRSAPLCPPGQSGAACPAAGACCWRRSGRRLGAAGRGCRTRGTISLIIRN